MPRSRSQGTPATRSIDLGADLEGEARDVAADHAQLALKARAEGKRIAILSGGELTVTVRGNGRGGPNQEYALALAGPAEGHARHFGAGRAIPTAPTAAPAARPIRPAR